MKPAVFQFTTAGVDASVDIALDAWRLTESQVVAILLGDEQITLEFYDVENLERLRDLADEGARRFREVIEANAAAAAAGAAGDRPATLVGGGRQGGA